MIVTREAVVAEARTWEHTPWRHQACLKGVAVDCLGLIKGVAVGLQLPVSADLANDPILHNYSRQPDGRALVAMCDRHLERTPEPGLGDLIVFAFALNPQHFGIVSQVSIYGNPTYIIHAYTSVGRVVENGINVAKARVVRAYRLPGVAP